ncbi:hypothetical protein [Shumkonia mesophila]|uniref:hypothetical protein n=1 Tax=Shumkonia mesophila TaxID=2838854 RepID=UPI0029343003|nr:hypothetical protein [Shumkonia mesophila]
MSDELDTLDRDELLQLVHNELVPAGRRLSHVVTLAQWQVASSRAIAARRKETATYDDSRPLVEAMDAAWGAWKKAVAGGNLNAADKAMRKWSRARDAYQAADATRRKLDSRADRLQRRADRLWEKLDTMKGRGTP